VNPQFIAGGLIILVAAGGLFTVTQFDVRNPFNVLDTDDVPCEYQTVEINGQTFTSKSEFRDGVEQRGGNWTEIDTQLEFRVSDGTLEYRAGPDLCEQLRGGTQ
jgi:hypothetical protein